jgi:FixJ family two-component response regulator
MSSAVETRHVLLIDDNPDIRVQLGNLLRHMGYMVETIEDPRALLSRRSWPTPAVILLDMRMPILTGLEVQHELSTMSQQVPIVFISGESQPQEIVRALKEGAQDFLIKPFGQGELARALDVAFERESNFREFRERRDLVRARCEELSPRERQVLQLILQGHSNKTLGEQLFIQAGTVKKHRAAIYQKFMVADLSGLLQLFHGIEGAGGLFD